MADRVEILNIKLDNVDMDEACHRVEEYIAGDEGKRMVVTPNSEMIVMAREDSRLADILNSADLSVPDGAGVILASRILRKGLRERVAGFDLMRRLFSRARGEDYSIYFLGGRPGIVDKARENVTEEYPGINISGTHHGYLDRQLQYRVIEEINELSPDLLFVGMGVPLQEKFLDSHLHELEVKVAMTVGGSFDVLAGEAGRAPLWMQKAYLEWFYRLLQEPGRFGRMLALPRFVLLVLRERFLNL
ncbi:MAG: WecB/TagA/CpsF family glycosyltransferase [Bacillota bacterium]